MTRFRAWAAAFLLAASTLAEAQLFRSYLASDGNDANACTLLAPCRLLPRALTAVADGGEIWMLDSGNFNTGQVDVEKSVTILAIPGALGSVVATGFGSALNINTPGVRVTLRNLVLKHLTNSFNGISFFQGSELNVADCEIVNMQTAGINATASGGKVTIRNTAVRGSGSGSGIRVDGTLEASLDGVHASGNGLGVEVRNNALVMVGDSVLSGNGQYGLWVSTTTGTVRVAIDRSTVSGNGNGIQVQGSGSGGSAELVISRSTVSHNSSGVQASKGPSAATNVVLDGNTISENSFAGVQFASGSPTIFTRGNNTFKFNGAAGTSDVVGGALSGLAGQ